MSGGIPITDPVKLAWCAFARDHEEKWRRISPGEQGLSIASFEAGAAWERGEAAELVRQAGCTCHPPDFEEGGVGAFNPVGGPDGLGIWTILEHGPRCPRALAAAIEARGRG